VSEKNKPDIFNPYVELNQIQTAGTVHIRSPHGDMVEISGGQPFQSAYDLAFRIAIGARMPLWKSHFYPVLLYHPDILGQSQEDQEG